MKRPASIFLLAAAMLAAETTPRLEPLTGLPPHPPDNPPTPEKIKLGQMLFFERMLSGGQRRSCGTCHKPELFFMDGFSRAWGLHDSQLRVKTPGLLNVGWQRSLFHDGRVKTLEEQAAFPLKNSREMAMDPEGAAERLRQDPVYSQIFERIYPGQTITWELVSKSIAAFERTLVSYDSDLDRYLQGDETALEPKARRGMDLFTGKAACIRCHHGPLLTDHQLHYNGVPESTNNAKPGTKYKTVSLRDVMRRTSYMHNGHYLKIEDVLEHYVRGGDAPEGLEAEISPVSLTGEEKAELIAFLRALDGRETSLEDGSELDLDSFSVKHQPPAPDHAQQPDPSYVNK